MENSKSNKSLIIKLGFLFTTIGAAPVLINLAMTLSSSFSNYYIKTLADNNPDNISYYGSFILSLSAFIAILYYWNIAKSTIRQFKDKYNPNKEVVNKISILSSQGKMEKEKLLLKLYSYLSKFAVIFFVVSAIFFINFYRLVSNVNTTFKNHTTILLPYVGQDEINKLNSQWL
jgi:hypothetical protein